MTIGARIGKPVDRNAQLAGDIWFYYAGRYGEFAGNADFLPAMVEAAPGRSESYFALAEYFRGAGNSASAMADYRGALELKPSRADVHDRFAVMAGSNDEKVKEWRLAIAALTDQMNSAHVPQTFWSDFNDVVHHIRDARAMADLRGEIDKLLRVYIRRNGSYQVEPLLEGLGDVAWIGELSTSAADPVRFLNAIIDRPWIPEAQKDILYVQMVESGRAQLARSFGEQRVGAQSELWVWEIQRAKYLLKRRENRTAAELVTSLGVEARKARMREVFPLELRVAARAGTLAAVLARYDSTVSMAILRDAAAQLVKDGDAASARRVLELVYLRELKAGKLDASNFLGLAEIRLEEKDTAAALALLRRMVLVSGEAFSGLEPAAALLGKTGYDAEAAEFLGALVKAEPWNWGARERLAAASGSVGELTTVAKAAEAPYAARAAAALALREKKAPAVTGTDAELMLLSGSNALSESDVSKPYFYGSRMEAAKETRDAAVRERLLAGAVAIDPQEMPPEIDLMRAALEARHDALAVGIAQRVGGEMIADETEFTSWVANGFMGTLPDAERVTLARGLGEAEQRLGNLRVALLYFQIAQRIEPADRVQTVLDTVRRRVEASAKNEGRRPVVSDHLDQDRLVRARVAVQ